LDLACLTGPIQHLRFTAKVMHRTKDKIEAVPVLFHPAQSIRRGNRIVVELDSGEDFNLWVQLSEAIKDPKINAGNVPVMIGECDAPDLFRAALVNPRLKQLNRVWAHGVPLWMGVVIAGGKHKG